MSTPPDLIQGTVNPVEPIAEETATERMIRLLADDPIAIGVTERYRAGTIDDTAYVRAMRDHNRARLRRAWPHGATEIDRLDDRADRLLVDVDWAVVADALAAQAVPGE